MNPKKQLLWSLWVGLGLLEVFRGLRSRVF